MPYGNTHRRELCLRPTAALSSLIAAALLLANVRCLSVRDEHCVLTGGDFACTSTEICIVPAEPVGASPVSTENGCYAFKSTENRMEIGLDDAPAGYVRAPFGVPAHFDAKSGEGPLDSLEEVLNEALHERGHDCELELTTSLRKDWSTVFRWLREERLGRQGRVSTQALALNEWRVDVLHEFNVILLKTLDRCHDQYNSGDEN
ncbi:MAG: hypothetical protein AAGF11_06095 [Myxococcota bacterium]